MLTRNAILAQMARRTKVIASDVFGGDLRIKSYCGRVPRHRARRRRRQKR